MREIVWKKINGFNYAVSSDGKVKRLESLARKGTGHSIIQADRETGISQGSIGDCLHNRRKKCRRIHMAIREIIFRGKRLDRGEWVVGSLIKMGPVGYVHHFVLPDYASAFYDIEVDPATIGQYTGLTDKNGVKIFEGDIVCDDEPEDMEYKPLPVFGVVEFGEYDGDLLSLEYKTTSDHVGFSVDWKDNEDGEYSKDYRRDLGYWIKYPYFTVCGNIHDNPELLEGGH